MRFSSPWTDHAVIQRDQPIILRGWADTSRAILRATLGPSHAVGATGWDGRFELRMPALEAGGPYDLRAWIEESGEEATLRDLLVGEVWLLSGQSNAGFNLKGYAEYEDPLGQTKQFLAEGGADPKLRIFATWMDALAMRTGTVDPNSKWILSDETTAPNLTALGAWFALFLRKRFPEMPIGIVQSSFGGSILTSWLSRNALAETPEGRELLAVQDEVLADENSWEKVKSPIDIKKGLWDMGVSPLIFTKNTQKDRGNDGEGRGYAGPDFDDSAWKKTTIPGSWIQQGIAGHGAMWFRKSVQIPASWSGHALRLEMGGVDKQDISYFNGVRVGATGKDFEDQYWNVKREYPVPAEIVQPGKANLIAVRVFCFYFNGGFPCEAASYCLRDTVTNETLPLAGDDWRAFPEYEITVKPVADRTAYSGPLAINGPHRLFDSMLQPLAPYPVRGVLWYQGESDSDSPSNVAHYLSRFQRLVQEWRYLWERTAEELPFCCVQLANWNSPVPEQWLGIQDAQRRACLTVPNCGCITGSDLALTEPDNLHPHDKRSYALRLYRLALAKAYGENDSTPQGPTLDTLTVEGVHLRAHFLFADGLHAPKDEPLRGFEIAGEDGVYSPAEACIDGDCVVLSAADVPTPKACRYNAKVGLPEGNLRNCAELPALSFVELAIASRS